MLSEDVQSRISKRKTYFLDYLQSKRKISRVDVYMAWLKEFSGKQIFDIDDQDVLDFLIFKDVNHSGRTVVHHRAFPNIGLTHINECRDNIRCSSRHSAASMRIGIVQKLRKGFEEVGRKGTFEPGTFKGDPTRSNLVKEYIAFKHMEQGQSGVLPNSAPKITFIKMKKLLENMRLDIRSRRGVIKLRLSERRAMYAFCFTAIKRLAGAGNIIAPNVIRMPNNRGFVFNCTWDKTLRMGSHCFGFLCMLHIESWCAHCIIDEWVLLAKSMNISFDRGLLFPRLEYDGTIKHNKRWRAKDLSDSLDRDLKRYNLFENESPHSFRHGGTVHSLQKGEDLPNVMYRAYMKNYSTAKIYSKGLSVLFPNFDWSKAGVDVSQISADELSIQMQSWRAFVDVSDVL
jgi:hypothetical protein